jgi:hypothetical protein
MTRLDCLVLAEESKAISMKAEMSTKAASAPRSHFICSFWGAFR